MRKVDRISLMYTHMISSWICLTFMILGALGESGKPPIKKATANVKGIDGSYQLASLKGLLDSVDLE